MALFERKKQTVQKQLRNTQQSVSATTQMRDFSSVLLKPHVTEKSAEQNDRGMYSFVIRRDATKYDVRDAMQALFKVTPRKVTIVNRVPRTSHSRAKGREVTVPGMKKANVFLKKGDRIDLA